MAEPVPPKQLTIWRLVDGKIGHEKQSQALVELLSTRREVECIDIPVQGSLFHYFICWAFKQEPCSNRQIANKPDLLIGTGHRTHWPLLAYKRYYQCKALVIMSPSLPACLFDAVLAPKHDYRTSTPPGNVITTTTALAPQVNSTPIENQGIILVGGESKHYHWEEKAIAEAIYRIVTEQSSDIHWQLSSSRRTPDNTLAVIQARCAELNNISISDHKTLPQQWLADSLKTAGHIWISADSASMIAEALMTKANVGLIELKPVKENGKLHTSNRFLLQEGYLKHLNSTATNTRKAINYDHTVDQVLHLLEL